jgi:hypothetical protein
VTIGARNGATDALIRVTRRRSPTIDEDDIPERYVTRGGSQGRLEEAPNGRVEKIMMGRG